MRRPLLFAYVAAFVAVCCLPAAVMLSGARTVNRENRALAELPAFVADGGPNLDFPKQFDSYMSDNFGLRQACVTAWDALNYYLLGTSPDSSVIAGRDGWLFYGGEAHDYLGRDVLGGADIARIVRTLELEREYLDSQGVAFVFTVAPNKSTIYGQYMPARYAGAHEGGNLEKLSAALVGSGVEYADLYAALKDAAKGDTQLYHRKDSHWNNAGALIGYRTLMASAARAMGGFGYDAYEGAPFEWKRVWEGDLEAMLLPGLRNLDWQAVYGIGQSFQYARQPKTMEDMRIAANGPGDRRLFMFRDSFANALIPFTSNAFGYACYVRSVPYDLTAAVKEQPDVVVEEIVERNIPDLMAAAPVMPAPARDIDASAARPGGLCATAAAKETNGLVKINGWISSQASPDGSAVYVELAGGAGSRVLEPFPIGEGERPAGGNVRGFTLYIDKGALEKGAYAVNVVVQAEGGLEKAATGLQVTIQ